MLCPWVCTSRNMSAMSVLRSISHRKPHSRDCRTSPSSRLDEEILHHLLLSRLWKRTLSEGIDGEFAVRVLRKVFERDFGLALSYHQMYNDHALVHDSPCGVSQSVREGSKYLRNTGFTRVGRDEDVFDILGLWGGELGVKSVWCDNVVC
jgi:hypothetical protein